MRINPRVMMLRFLPMALALVASLLPSTLLFASIEEGIQSYRQKKYATLLDQLPFDHLENLTQQELYLLYKTLLQLKDYRRAGQVLNYLIPLTPTPLKTAIFYEQMQYLQQSKQLVVLLDFIAHAPQGVENPFITRQIRSLLLRKFRRFTDTKRLRQSLQSIFTRFPQLAKDTKLRLLLFNNLPEGSNQRKEMLLSLWASGDVTQLPTRVRREARFILNQPENYEKLLLQHFVTQKKERNYRYLRKTLPRFLSYFRNHDHEAFRLLRNLYFTSLLKTRRYSLALRVLNSKESQLFFHFEEKESASWRFDFLLKKEKLSQAVDLLNRGLQKGLILDPQKRLLSLATYYYQERELLPALHFLNRIDLDQLQAADQATRQWMRFQIHDRLKHRRDLVRIAAWAHQHPFVNPKKGAKFCYWSVKLSLISDLKYMDCYRQYPFTYYGLKAKEVASPYKQVFSVNLNQGPEEEYRKLTPEENFYFAFIELLYNLDEGALADSLIKDQGQNIKDRSWFTALADLLTRQQRFYLLHGIVADQFNLLSSPQYYGEGYILPLNYPLAYEELITQAAKKNRLSPFLIFAVMREESRFRPYVKSGAGAIGLLQLMPGTAHWVGRRERIKVRTWELVNPKVNISLGSAYLKYLTQRFEGNNYQVLAAYNGGGTHVKRWLKATKGQDTDYFVEAINFGETRNYVKRVMKSYYLYQAIYAKYL